MVRTPHSSWRRNSPFDSIAVRASATIFVRVASSAWGSSRITRSYVGAGSVMRRRRLAGLSLRADVRELLVDPVAGVAGGDDLDQALGAPAPLRARHRQRGVDRVGELLNVEWVDRQRETP